MTISTKDRYVARMLLDIAMHQGNEYVPMKDGARRQQIPRKYQEVFTAPLETAGILGVRRGKTSGCRLLASPDSLTLWDVMCLAEALSTPISVWNGRQTSVPAVGSASLCPRGRDWIRPFGNIGNRLHWEI